MMLPGAALGAVFHLTRVAATAEDLSLAGTLRRTNDGTLHLVYSAQTAWSSGFDGLGSISISPSGHLGPVDQALAGWHIGTPGLTATPSGTLEAIFGGNPDVGGGSNSGPWAVTSTNGGASWSAPVYVGVTGKEPFGGDVSANLTGGGTVITAAAAGGAVIQQGLGTGASAFSLTPPDAPIGGVTSVLDTSGEIVASWYALEGGSGLYLQRVSPSLGPVQEVVGNLTTWGGQARQLGIASLDNGPGVYAAYAPDDRHVRLVRYGGSSVQVASFKTLNGGQVGIATGPDGRLWIMWATSAGPNSEVFATRSNKARTAFEPVQHSAFSPESLTQLFGDGRLGPLDLFVDMTPNVAAGNPLVPGLFYTRILPVLSAAVSVVKEAAGKFKLAVHVDDAGDPVSGATVSAAGAHQKTSALGNAKLIVKGSAGHHVGVTVTAPGYALLVTGARL